MDEDRRIINQVVGAFGPPAFARRGIRVQAAYEELVRRCQAKRFELLEMTRLRLATLHALIAGEWTRLNEFVNEPTIAWLAEHFSQWQPALRMPVTPTRSHRVLRRALGDLRESMELFNRRWQRLMGEIDLSEINALREGYNRYYLLEKECALGSARTARQGFVPLPVLTMDEVWRLFPLLQELPGEP